MKLFPFRPSSSTALSRRARDGSEPSLRAPRLLLAPLWRLNVGAHKRDLSALLVALMVALALCPQVLNFAHRDDFERDIVRGALGWQVLETAEGWLLDQRFVARGAIVPRSAKNIAIVAIDQASLRKMAQWPWPRAWHAQLIQRLKKAGARVIVLDVNFAYKQNPLPNGALSKDDKSLVAASAAAGNVLFSSGFRAQLRGVESGAGGQTRDSNEVSTPFDELDATSTDVGFNWVPSDALGQTRSYAWRADVAGVKLASLSALAVGMFQNKLDGGENKKFFQVLERGQWPDARGRAIPVPLHEMRVGPDDRAWSTPIFFWGPEGTFATYPYASVLHGTSQEWSDAGLRRKFEGRIVFVGATASVLKDTFAAPPFNDNHNKESYRATIPGVELQAGIAAQMLDGRYLQQQSSSSTWAWLFAMCLGNAVWMSILRAQVSRAARRAQGAWSRLKAPGRIHSLVWFGLYALLGPLPVIGFWSWAQWELSNRDTSIVMIYPLLGAVVSASSALLLFFVAESGDRRKVMARFSRQVSPDVLEDQLARHEEVDDKPYRAQVTVLFSDLEGFTSFSEGHSAEEVGEALDEYMTRMVEVVHGHGGTLDKFIGDAVMAFFGAPTPRFDHAAQALACAVAMQEECGRFRRDTGIEFYMRVGVHSGEVIAGMMGARDRANYTVIGDTVNLASRLESKNKELGSRILCSGNTFAMAPELIEAEPTRVSIKGLERQVDVWVVRGLKALPPSENWHSLPEAAPQPGAFGDEAPSLLPAPEAAPAPLALPSPRTEEARDPDGERTEAAST